ncbi:MAG: rod shape-determining protein RodA [Gemmatimonadales bacterium]|jgi:rod shape determining protein RodA
MRERLERWLGDPALLGGALLLALIGVGMIWSAGQLDVPSDATGIWRRQVLWLSLSLCAFAFVSRVPLRWVEVASPAVYGVSVALLAAVLATGSGPGVASWFRFGGASFQPAELAKLGTILMLARVLANRRVDDSRILSLWRPLAITMLPFGLVLLQPDLGSAITFGVILIGALFWAGVPLFTIFMLVSPGVSLLLGFSATVWGGWFILVVALIYLRRPYLIEGVGVVVANLAAGAIASPLWNQLAEYQQNRLLVFLDPGRDPRGAGWQLIQSQVAIGSGGLFGQGFGQGPQKRLSFLPEQHTDFIFSVVGEELGFIGVVVLLALFAWLLRRMISTATLASDEFGNIVVFCLFAVWFSHLLINIGMTVGLMPITGLPLPFISYGGSFLLMTFVGIALASRVAIEN